MLLDGNCFECCVYGSGGDKGGGHSVGDTTLFRTPDIFGDSLAESSVCRLLIPCIAMLPPSFPTGRRVSCGGDGEGFRHTGQEGSPAARDRAVFRHMRLRC